MTAPVRVIQVGAGGMGRVWLELLAGTPAVEIVALVDLDLELARVALEALGLAGVTVATSITEVLRSRTADAVVDITVPGAHHPVNTEALFAGLPVLCEKPIAPTVSRALSLAAASEVSGRLLMTSQSRRYYRTLSRLKEQLGSLGELGMATTHYAMAPRFGGFREEMASPLLLDMAIHAFDAARYLLDADPVSVYCDSFSPPWSWYAGDAAASAIFEFAGGLRYTYVGSWCSPGFETSWNGTWRVSGAEGTATWDGESDPAVDPPSAGSGDSAHGPETIAASLAEFLHALRTGEIPSGEVHSNVISLAMVEAAVESAATGRRVVIADLLERSYLTAVAQESRPDVRTALMGWGSAAAGLGGRSRN
ncbi:MAG: Gfo/Idh/MocA family oxidoreductase [Burkholderiaceae bacterium]|nr:Gfo/Idh/MocA family oxidoreductase [Microbacteriaceae bacterium]